MKIIVEYESLNADDSTLPLILAVEAPSVAHVNEKLEQLARAALKAGEHEFSAFNAKFALAKLMQCVPKHKVDEWSARAERGHQMPLLHLDNTGGFRRYKRPVVHPLETWFDYALKRAEQEHQEMDE